MKKIFLYLALPLTACTFPSTPEKGTLIQATTKFQKELFDSGSRGIVVVSMSDNISTDKFFGKKYTNIIDFKNINTGELYTISTNLKNKFSYAMLPVGEYKIRNMYLEYTTVTTNRIGNMTVRNYNIETIEGFEGNKNITFVAKPKEANYIGHFHLIKGETKYNKKPELSFKLSNKLSELNYKKDIESKIKTNIKVNLAKF